MSWAVTIWEKHMAKATTHNQNHSALRVEDSHILHPNLAGAHRASPSGTNEVLQQTHATPIDGATATKSSPKNGSTLWTLHRAAKS